MQIVLSFDDGRRDNFEVAVPILKKYNLPATFNIATAYVDGTIMVNERPCPNTSMSIDNVKDLYRDGFEISCHGDHHRNDIDDIKMGLNKLSDWLSWDDDHKPGFASPQSNLSADEIRARIDDYKSIFAYMRISSYEEETLISRTIRKAAHISHSKYLYNKAFKNNIGGIRDGFIAASVPIIHSATVDQVQYLIEKSKVKGKDCILMFHSILSRGSQFYDDLWSWDADSFDKLCRWLDLERNKQAFDVVNTIDLV